MHFEMVVLMYDTLDYFIKLTTSLSLVCVIEMYETAVVVLSVHFTVGPPAYKAEGNISTVLLPPYEIKYPTKKMSGILLQF